MKNIYILHVVLFILFLKIVLLLVSPIFRFGDDLRYLASAKTIFMSNDVLPEKEKITNNLIWYPPFVLYILTALLSLSFKNQFLWFIFSKIFELFSFLGSTVIILKILRKLNFSKNEKILCLLLFTLYPINMFLSSSIMLDSPLIFFMLLLFWFIFYDKNYLIGSVICGLLVLIKSSGILLVISSIISVILFEKNKSLKIKYFVFVVIFCSIISGFWIYHNYIVLGTPIYDPWTKDEINLYKERSFTSNLFYGYLSFWGLPPSYRISSRLNMSNEFIFAIQILIALFFMPLSYLIIYKTIKDYKKTFYFIPFVVIFFVFGLYYFLKTTFSDIPRYIFPIFPIFCIYFSRQLNFNNKFLKLYIVSVLFVFIFISFSIQIYFLNKEYNIKNNLLNIINENQDKKILIQSKDREIFWILNLYYNIDMESTQEACKNFINKGPLSYCVDKNKIIIFRQFSTINYGEVLITI
ncbi:MAG: hypothetical protein J4428_02350 [Candidatus Aenigmarchaeota archaeon]|nr:hypothetical protein [Candidatus Aenigmarchaeota archaeon]